MSLDISISHCKTNDTFINYHFNKEIHLEINDIISFIASYFVDIIIENREFRNERPLNKNDIFYSNKIPLITTEEFIIRIEKYTHLECSTLISAFIYTKRLIEKENYIIGLNNLYRIFLGACIIATKFNEDSNFKNKYYAKIGGLILEEMNLIEYNIYSRIDFNLIINEKEYFEVINNVLRNHV